MPAETYLQTVERIEPDIHPLDQDGSIASIAISSKRSADALERIANALDRLSTSTGIATLIADVQPLVENLK